MPDKSQSSIYSKTVLALLGLSLGLTACVKGPNPDDPFEAFNRKTHKFNMAFDATFLRPPAKFYRAAVPAPIRVGINNAYNNVNLIPSIANDLLQADWRYVIKDSWRLLINTTLGVAGVFDVAEKFGLPHHSNDLGITLAKWGDRHSPYVVIPFLGPSTVRDGMSLIFDYYLSPYPYLHRPALTYSLLGLRYVDLRSQMLDTERFIQEAIDKYAFIRDAYLQHRNYLIQGGEQQVANAGSDKGANSSENLYVDENEPAKPQPPLLREKPNSQFPLTTN